MYGGKSSNLGLASKPFVVFVEAMAGVVDEVTIKKEIEDSPESPEHGDTQDSNQNQSENQSGQKQTKVWGEDETRSLIELHKAYVGKLKDSSYSKRQLLEDISHELQMIGYDTTPENVRNKMKYLRGRYKNVLEYNAKHVEKRIIPFQEELEELYSMDYFEDQEPFTPKERNGNGSDDISYKVNGSERLSKRTSAKSTIPASHVDLRTVVTSKKKIEPVKVKFSVKRKLNGKSRSQPWFQCGLCMEKFRTSFDMHGHSCKGSVKANVQNTKKKQNSSNSASSIFHWNSLITMQFLDLLKEYQDSHKNSNFRKGNIWDNMAALMKRLGHRIPSKELAKKWNTLSTAYEKSIAYNKTHKDKKKCAFFKRLMDLHRHPSSFDCFKTEEPVKMTVEVSPFSFATRDSGPISSRSSNSNSRRKSNEDKKFNPEENNNVSELISWLNNTWTEWKELDKKREALEVQRHNELMEMLSFLVESKTTE